jgi:hypothetical protein
VAKINIGGVTSVSTKVADVGAAVALAKAADHVVLVVDNSKDGGGEGHDR